MDVKILIILLFSIAWQGSSIPIVWICLMKSGGNSNTKERITLMKRLLKLIPAEKIDSLLADREFIGEQWFQWLKDEGILFRLRIRKNMMIKGKHGQEARAEWLFRHVR